MYSYIAQTMKEVKIPKGNNHSSDQVSIRMIYTLHHIGATAATKH